MCCSLQSQALSNLAHQFAEKFICAVSNLHVLADAQFEHLSDKLYGLLDNLLLEEFDVRTQQLHGGFHDALVLHVLDRLNGGLQQDVEPVDLFGIQSATILAT
jgi:hypothetical protein